MKKQFFFSTIHLEKSEASQPFRAGVMPYGSASLPGKGLGLFNIASPDPVPKDGVKGSMPVNTKALCVLSSHKL